MSNINQLSARGRMRPQDQIAYWDQMNGQPRRASVWELIELVTDGIKLKNGLLNASSLYTMRRTQAGTLDLTTAPAVVMPYDANGNTVLPPGGTSLTQNVTTGLLQATRAIEALNLWVALDGTLPSPRVMTLQVQTGPVGGTLYTSEFQSIQTGTGTAQVFHFAGVLQNPNNINGQIDQGDIIQLVATADEATTLSISRVTLIAQPLDGA